MNNIQAHQPNSFIAFYQTKIVPILTGIQLIVSTIATTLFKIISAPFTSREPPLGKQKPNRKKEIIDKTKKNSAEVPFPFSGQSKSDIRADAVSTEEADEDLQLNPAVRRLFLSPSPMKVSVSPVFSPLTKNDGQPHLFSPSTAKVDESPIS